MIGYVRPKSMAEALTALADKPYTPLAGGTDIYPAHVGKPLPDGILDLGAVDELRGIHKTEQGYRIGALTSWQTLIRTELPPCFDGLKQAAAAIGGSQIQAVGTLGGNLCNASPAADGMPNLLALDAQVELQSVRKTHRLSLAEFIQGNRRTARQPDELLTAIYIPADADARSVFMKLGARKYLVISIAMLAVVLKTDAAGRLYDVRIAVGACSEVAQRLSALEQALSGQVYAPELLDGLASYLPTVVQPIDDVRATAEYRLAATAVLLRRALSQLAEPAT